MVNNSSDFKMAADTEKYQLPYPKDGFCGKSPRVFENRIFGGEETCLGKNCKIIGWSDGVD